MVLHCDISLLNLLFVLWDPLGDGDWCLDFLDDLPPDTHMCLWTKMKDSITYCGLLADWGYAVPLDTFQTQAEPMCTSQLTPPTPPCNLPLTSSVSLPSHQSSEMGDDSITICISAHGQEDWIVCVGLSQLRVDHDIVLSMGRDHPPDQSQPSIDTNPLYCMVGFSLHKTTRIMLTKVL